MRLSNLDTAWVTILPPESRREVPMPLIVAIALLAASLLVLAGCEYLRMQPGSGGVERPAAATVR